MTLKVFMQAVIKSFNNQLLNNSYKVPLGKREIWKDSYRPHVKQALILNRVKFSVIQVNSSKSKFSLRYMCLYYIQRILKLIDKKEILLLKKQ
eukprot:TRINITY_DN21785_c0_g1_i1.p1 TRINITY_DN21785_c0_g1~~TRINITY_DN21785_c0_g1_i1.p1  ORF type:complete len:100 (-),score=2.37 TRINITY_DN21785_c0_g1_i1:27-305(-)